jgi:hypothetical protein
MSESYDDVFSNTITVAIVIKNYDQYLFLVSQSAGRGLFLFPFHLLL